MNASVQPLSFESPPDYCILRRTIYAIKGRCETVKAFPIGRSVLGRSIFAIGIGTLRHSTLYVGGVHGLEYLTICLLLRFADELSVAYESGACLDGIDIRKVLTSRGILIVPCLNPDGTEIAIHGAKGARELADYVSEIANGDFSNWQANANGVDLNHNFDAGFEILRQMEREQGITGPAPRQYGGEFPNSEPENRVICSLCRLFDVQKLLAFHSQGEEIFYQYGDHTPPRSHLIAELLADASGYKLVSQSGLASHGGLKDWFIEKMQRPGFTIEIGKGKNPLPVSDFPEIYDQLKKMLILGILL